MEEQTELHRHISGLLLFFMLGKWIWQS